MSGQPGHQEAHEGGSERHSAEELSDQGAGLGMSGEGTTFEPEETPEAVDDPDSGTAGRGGAAGLEDVVQPRELVPDEDRADELEAPRDVLPDDQRDVDDDVEPESERLLPDDERPVPGGPDDD